MTAQTPTVQPVHHAQAMTAQTQSFSWQPSRATLAARSLHAVDRIKDDDERREAFKKHLEQFPPLWSLV